MNHENSNKIYEMFLKRKIESSVAVGIIVIVSVVTVIVLINEGKEQTRFYDDYYKEIGVK